MAPALPSSNWSEVEGQRGSNSLLQLPGALPRIQHHLVIGLLRLGHWSPPSHPYPTGGGSASEEARFVCPPPQNIEHQLPLTLNGCKEEKCVYSLCVTWGQSLHWAYVRVYSHFNNNCQHHFFLELTLFNRLLPVVFFYFMCSNYLSRSFWKCFQKWTILLPGPNNTPTH